MSLDSLDEKTFAAMNDMNFPLHRVLAGLDAALALGFRPIKLNMVVKRSVNDSEVAAMAERFAGPDFKTRHTFYPDAKKSKSKNTAGEEVEFPGFKGALGNENDYSDNFIAYTADFNGDGWADILVIGFPGKEESTRLPW